MASQSINFEELLPSFKSIDSSIIAALAIGLHVAEYNATAHLEYHTRIFTKVGLHYFYK